MDFLLLDDRANLKLSIIRKLEQQYSFSERKDMLCEQLNISQYLLERSVLEINEDLKRFELIDEMELIEQNNEIILFQGSQMSSSIVEERYLKYSLEFTLLQTIFFNQFTSIKKYGEKEGMSRTVVYKIIDRIRKELEQYDIKLSKTFQLIGNEMQIRQYFNMLYYRIYKDSDELYNQSDILAVNELLSAIKLHCEEINTFYLFKHYMFVMLERVKRKHNYFLSTNAESTKLDEENVLYQTIKHWSSRTLQGTNREIEVEVRGIVSQLSVYRSEFCDFEDEAVEAYSLQLKQQILNYPQLTMMGPEFSDSVNMAIYQHRYITPLIDLTLRVMDLEFFHERYPIVFEICYTFIYQLKKDEFQFSKKSLFFNLLIILSQQYDQENEKNTINIHVNFTQGEKYNQFIKTQIKIFDSFSINFQPAIRPDTDLIISDYIPKTTFSARSLIWLAPPRASDWRNFGNEIIQINKNLQLNKNRI
ncbi:helix-turn-helix domain-containing protein [Candidatus Enterococcus ikei]|uniref:Helix-turn-helix domain-containing protein n=1 Tax=Candidatus Enterococcus ikei TaxID=2815326 RepID=A0ABS3GZT7_9ENTE|nr:helix-turn-helix domain-containing protein [Enterococcus sp. DIV0869a]MBO0440773.1 helix-turn-helix domain-containing protein [Enterococcus sp. DIV0869a]